MKRFLISASLTLASLTAFPAYANVVQLILPDEAKLPDQQPSLIPRGIVRGPGVQVVSPELGSAVSGAFDLRIKFEARGGNKVDPESVKLTYLKNPAIDLTGRIKSGVSDTGLFLAATEVPVGEHLIRVSVKDVNGRESAIIITLSVHK